MTDTPTVIDRILHWQDVHQGRIDYNESAPTRLDWETPEDLKSPTDCSGMAARMFRHFSGVDIGTYTGNECQAGKLVTRSKAAAAAGYGMLKGDCILFDWNWPGGDGYFNWDHIAIYDGAGMIWNHGGPGKGPLHWSLADNVNRASHVMVRRFLPWAPDVISRPPVHGGAGHHPSPNPLHGHPIPALIARGTGDYYGLITGPNRSHGGAYLAERPAIRLIQQFLNWKMAATLQVDGIFGPTTRHAVAEFQRKFEPNTEFYGQVWFDDWHKMASL